MSRIGLDELSQAASANDARADAGEVMAQWAARNDVDLVALISVVGQRALRAAALFIDGMDPAVFRNAKEDFIVPLSARATAMLPMFATCVVDGFAIGLAVKPKEDKPS